MKNLIQAAASGGHWSTSKSGKSVKFVPK